MNDLPKILNFFLHLPGELQKLYLETGGRDVDDAANRAAITAYEHAIQAARYVHSKPINTVAAAASANAVAIAVVARTAAVDAAAVAAAVRSATADAVGGTGGDGSSACGANAAATTAVVDAADAAARASTDAGTAATHADAARATLLAVAASDLGAAAADAGTVASGGCRGAGSATSAAATEDAGSDTAVRTGAAAADEIAAIARAVDAARAVDTARATATAAARAAAATVYARVAFAADYYNRNIAATSVSFNAVSNAAALAAAAMTATTASVIVATREAYREVAHAIERAAASAADVVNVSAAAGAVVTVNNVAVFDVSKDSDQIALDAAKAAANTIISTLRRRPLFINQAYLSAFTSNVTPYEDRPGYGMLVTGGRDCTVEKAGSSVRVKTTNVTPQITYSLPLRLVPAVLQRLSMLGHRHIRAFLNAINNSGATTDPRVILARLGEQNVVRRNMVWEDLITSLLRTKISPLLQQMEDVKARSFCTLILLYWHQIFNNKVADNTTRGVALLKNYLPIMLRVPFSALYDSLDPASKAQVQLLTPIINEIGDLFKIAYYEKENAMGDKGIPVDSQITLKAWYSSIINEASRVSGKDLLSPPPGPDGRPMIDDPMGYYRLIHPKWALIEVRAYAKVGKVERDSDVTIDNIRALVKQEADWFFGLRLEADE